MSNFFLNNRMYWATRTSFNSDIAVAAKELWQKKYTEVEKLISKDLTLICEFVHKKTKILIDYDFEDFVLIRVVNRITGYIYTRQETEDFAKRIKMKTVVSLDIGIEEMIRKWKHLTTETEGYIINFEGGYSVKLSSNFYNSILRCSNLSIGIYYIKSLVKFKRRR
ncbi:hypothetical protein ABEW03_04775 [Virgibacillus pantothenticus]|uniref:hypothetical protein n=1 Tax=Virgibacillus pantothenticus TaxID=1473 RepID=UPI003D27F99F